MISFSALKRGMRCETRRTFWGRLAIISSLAHPNPIKTKACSWLPTFLEETRRDKWIDSWRSTSAFKMRLRLLSMWSRPLISKKIENWPFWQTILTKISCLRFVVRQVSLQGDPTKTPNYVQMCLSLSDQAVSNLLMKSSRTWSIRLSLIHISEPTRPY